MKVIFLDGPSNSGKTTTLKLLYSQLKSAGSCDILPTRSCPLSSNDNEYYVSYEDKRVGIVTMGDFALETILYMGIFLERGADVLVIANSNKGFPYNVVNWHKRDLERVVIKKLRGANDDLQKVQVIISNL